MFPWLFIQAVWLITLFTYNYMCTVEYSCTLEARCDMFPFNCFTFSLKWSSCSQINQSASKASHVRPPFWAAVMAFNLLIGRALEGAEQKLLRLNPPHVNPLNYLSNRLQLEGQTGPPHIYSELKYRTLFCVRLHEFFNFIVLCKHVGLICHSLKLAASVFSTYYLCPFVRM